MQYDCFRFLISLIGDGEGVRWVRARLDECEYKINTPTHTTRLSMYVKKTLKAAVDRELVSAASKRYQRRQTISHNHQNSDDEILQIIALKISRYKNPIGQYYEDFVISRSYIYLNVRLKASTCLEFS
jgi:hypothetical protein